MTSTISRQGATRIPGRRALVLNSAAALLTVIAFCVARGPTDSFLYDAAQYWNGPIALVNGTNAADVGALSMRGALTPLVYLPPAFVSSALGQVSAGWAVLVWNSLLAAAVCVFLLPRIAAVVAPGGTLVRIWLSAVLGGAVFSGFAQHPLLDTWAVFAALTGFYLLVRGHRWWTAVLAGIAFAVSVNLRPSYVVPLAIAVAVLLVVNRRGVGLMVAGAVLGLIPQFVLNLVHYGLVGVVPYGTSSLSAVQAAQATYAVRYDTILGLDRHPQQWYCDPVYAARVVGDSDPKDQWGVVASIVDNLPHSLWFLTEKAAASLQWSAVTPYAHAPGAAISLTALLTVGIASTGLVALVVRAVLARHDRVTFVVTLSILGFWLGSLAALVLSTPETRFAIPLVAVGLVGILTAVPTRIPSRQSARPVVIGIAASVLVSLALFGAGRAGLAHPVPPGPLQSASTCASL